MGYAEAAYWRLTSDRGRLLTANLLGGVSIPLACLVFGAIGSALTGLPPTFWLTLGQPASTVDPPLVAAVVAALAISIVLHEITHGLAITLCGGHPRYGFQWAGLIPYATAPGQLFSRDQYVLVALAPLVALSLLGTLALMATPPGLAPFLMLGLVANAAGAVGDVWMSIVALRYPPSARIMDERDGMRIFVRDEA